MRAKLSIGKVRVAIAAIVAGVTAAAFASSAAASPGYFSSPIVECRSDSQLLTMTANANAQSGFTLQWIHVTFYFRNTDTGNAYQWGTDFQNYYNAYAHTTSPGHVRATFSVPRGHYVVWAAYSWWNGYQWTDTTGWAQSHEYWYTAVVQGTTLPAVQLDTSCPVGVVQ
jgi:hypothetical protein